MYRELYQYFIQYNRLTIPGVGQFLLERKPAVSDFPNRIIHAPAYSIILAEENGAPGKNFFNWLGQALHVSDRDAVIRFNDFSFDLKRQLIAGDSIRWNGMGVLSRGLGGEIKFEPELLETEKNKPVKAEKVIRENAEHTVRVGEDEKTSSQMIELLNQRDSKKSYWWAWALVVALLAIMFLGWYFSAYGLEVAAAGNSSHIDAQEATTTYRVP